MNKLIFFYIIGIFLILFVNVYEHETAHKAIGEIHLCNESKITYNIFGGEYQCLNYLNRSNEVRLQERHLHSMNEIVGYNTGAIIVSMVISTIMICVTILKKGD